MLESIKIKMQKFNKLKSIPAYLPIVNIDTDMIIPKQFLKTIKRTGLGKNLFFEMRYDDKGNEINDFVLNQKQYNGSKILIAVKNGKDLEARRNLLVAASMGSTAFQKGLGAIHSLSHPINSQFNVHHGLSNAIFMPYVLTFNKSLIEKRIVTICDYLNLDKNFDSFLNWILDLRKDLNIPHKLSDVVDESNINIDKLSQMALDDPSTATNPKKMTIDDMKNLYEYSFSGKLF